MRYPWLAFARAEVDDLSTSVSVVSSPTFPVCFLNRVSTSTFELTATEGLGLSVQIPEKQGDESILRSLSYYSLVKCTYSCLTSHPLTCNIVYSSPRASKCPLLNTPKAETAWWLAPDLGTNVGIGLLDMDREQVSACCDLLFLAITGVGRAVPVQKLFHVASSSHRRRTPPSG